MRLATLTDDKASSVMGVFALSWPLMISIMSCNIMFFVDRWLLSWYSLDAMNAVSVVHSIAGLFQFAPLSITTISEVFVGQFNGAKRYGEIGRPVWQMIWLSLFLSIFYIPIAYFGVDYLSPICRKEGGVFFQWIVGTAYLAPLVGALSGFYEGRGQVKILTFSALAVNALNVVFAAVFIFGFGPVPSMGTKGAALATVCAQVLHVGILFAVFISASSRKNYRTHDFRFHKKQFLECIKIGLPNGLSRTVEFLSWSILINAAGALGSEYITISSISSSFFVLFMFLVEGTQKAVMAISSNLIGAQKIHLISRVLRSSLKMHLVVVAILFVPFVLFSGDLVRLFLHDPLVLSQFEVQARWSLFFVWAFLALDGLNWIICGILTSAGDTRFLLAVNMFNHVFVSFLPTYYFVIVQKGSPVLIWGLGIPYAIIALSIFSWRYSSQAWRHQSIESTSK